MTFVRAFAVALAVLARAQTVQQDLNVKVCAQATLTVTLSASRTSIPSGDSSTLSWTSSKAANFTLTDLGPVSGASASVTPAGVGDHAYTLTAQDECGNTGSATVTISVHKRLVYLEGSRYSSGPSIADYMMTPGMYCSDCIGGSLLSTSKNYGDAHVAAASRSDFDSFISDVKSWPHSVEAYSTAHVGGNTYIVDEDGNVLGSMPTLSIYNTGVPGLSYVGDPFGTGGRNKLYVGDGDFQYKGGDYEVVGFISASPIVLDLDGDGRPDVDRGQWLPHPGRFNKSKAALFDINAIGFPAVTEWIGPHDGLLVAPLKPGETVEGGQQLFGNPIGYVDGYQKLGMLYDKDKNGYIEGKELDGFMVWQDLNGNGRVDAGELKSVRDWHITRIGATHRNLQGTFVIDGKERSTWDWWPTCMIVYPKPVAQARAGGAPKL